MDKYGLFVTAITQMGDWALNSASENCTLVGAYDPVQAEGDALHIRWQSELVTGEGVAISAACPEPELAAAYLDYWYSEEGYLLLNYGIEGETYTFVDGVPTYTEFVTDNPDGYTLTDMTNAYTKTRGAFLVSWERNLVAYTDAQVEAMDIWAYSDNAYAIPNSATLNTEENELYTAYYNDCITYVQETLPAFICGNLALNEETWAEYIATLESMGIQNCIDAKQSALDRFIAS